MAEEADCSKHIDRDNLTRCAVHASLEARAEQHAVHALEGRRQAASVLTGFNPVLGVTAGPKTSIDANHGVNWSVSLTQELETGGQRGARQEAVGSELAAQTTRVVWTERQAAAEAWSAYFETLAAAGELALAQRMLALSEAMDKATRARADKGLLAGLEVDLVQAETVKRRIHLLEAQRQTEAARVGLLSMLGLAGLSIAVEGDLNPLGVPGLALTPTATDARLDVQIAEKQRESLGRQAETLRRSRLPNVSVSLFAQQDSFEGRVLGLGLGVPVPIPGWGRTWAGEIAELEALAQRAATEADAVRRRARAAVDQALVTWQARERAVRALPPEQVHRAEKTLEVLAREVQAGRLTVRDAIVLQQAMVDLLQLDLENRRGLCLASVELLRALDAPLERGAP